jgi:predicted lysophospholipase L1 biosynthesis ABC-type transport system permease subunit
MAKALWPHQDPIGRTFTLASDPQHAIRVAGVAHDSRYGGVHGKIGHYFYLPFAQHYANNSLETLQVRTVGPPQEQAREIERVIASVAPELPVFDVKPMKQALYTLNGLLIFQIGAGLAAALGLLGLLLAAVGVYGVISYAASQQTHEIGVRMALGARPFNILGMMLREGMVIVGIGLVLGLAAAFAAAKLVGGFLVVSATDPQTYITVSAVLLAVALLACYVPARRAMRLDPMTALRWD